MAVLVFVMSFALTGCSTGACAGAAQRSPGVWLDATAWLHAHPDASLRACLDERCMPVDRARGLVFVMAPLKKSPPQTTRYTLTLASSSSQELRVSKAVELSEFQMHGPCGTVSWWSADARLHKDGALTTWKGDGQFQPASPNAPTPSATGGA